MVGFIIYVCFQNGSASAFEGLLSNRDNHKIGVCFQMAILKNFVFTYDVFILFKTLTPEWRLVVLSFMLVHLVVSEELNQTDRIRRYAIDDGLDTLPKKELCFSMLAALHSDLLSATFGSISVLY